MDKNLPANAGDTSSSSWSRKIPYAAEQLSQRATATEAHVFRSCTPKQEKPLQWEAQASELESSPHSQLEKAQAKQPKIK